MGIPSTRLPLMSFPERSSVYSRPGVYRGSASFTHNGSTVGQHGATSNPIGGRALFDVVPRNITSSGRTCGDMGDSPWGSMAAFKRDRHMVHSESNRTNDPYKPVLRRDVDRSDLGKPAPCGGQHMDRRGTAHINAYQLQDTLRQEGLVKATQAAYGGSILGTRFVESPPVVAAEPPGFHAGLSGRFAPLYDLPPTGGVMADADYVEAFHECYKPMEAGIQREMIEIHRNEIPIGSDRWA